MIRTCGEIVVNGNIDVPIQTHAEGGRLVVMGGKLASRRTTQTCLGPAVFPASLITHSHPIRSSIWLPITLFTPEKKLVSGSVSK